MRRQSCALSGFAFLLLAATAAHAAPLRVAVMPFKELAASKTHAWIGPGLAETLTQALAAVPDLRVVERSQLKSVQTELKLSADQVAEDDGAVKVGRLIAAKRMVLGSYQIAGGEILINGRFVDTQTGVVQQGQTFQLRGKVDRIFDLYPKLTERVMKTLGVEVSGKAAEAVQAVQTSTSSLPAQELYVSARERFHERTVDSLRQAVDLLQKAKMEDPSYALAFASLAEAQAELGHLECGPFYPAMQKDTPERCGGFYDPSDTEMAQKLGFKDDGDAHDQVNAKIAELRKRCERWPQVALGNANTAASLSPSLPAAHRALGLVYWFSGQRAKADLEARTLVNLNKGDAWGYYLLGLCSTDPEESRAYHQKSIEIDENLAANYAELAEWAYQDGKEPEALQLLQKGLRLAVGHPDMRLMSAELELRAKRPKEALGHINVVLGRIPEHPKAHFLRGLALWMTGGPDKPWDAREQWMDAAYLEMYRASLWNRRLCHDYHAMDPWEKGLPKFTRSGEPYKAWRAAYKSMREHIQWHNYDLREPPKYCAAAGKGKVVFLDLENKNKAASEFAVYMLLHKDRTTEKETVDKWWNEFADRGRLDFETVVCTAKPVTPDDEVRAEFLFDGKPQPAFTLTDDGHDPVYAGMKGKEGSMVGGTGRFTRKRDEFRVRGRFVFVPFRAVLQDESVHTLTLRVKVNGKQVAEGKVPFHLFHPKN